MAEEEKTEFVKGLNEGPYLYRDIIITFKIGTSICLTHVASILLTQMANQAPSTYLDYFASFSAIKMDKTANVPPPFKKTQQQERKKQRCKDEGERVCVHKRRRQMTHA